MFDSFTGSPVHVMMLSTQNPLICFLCCPQSPQKLSQTFHLKGDKTRFFIVSECPQTFSTFIPLPKKGDFKQCVQITEQLLLSSHMQARSFFGSYSTSYFVISVDLGGSGPLVLLASFTHLLQLVLKPRDLKNCRP